MSAHLRALINRAYDIIEDTTPIPADCGRLCGSACCEGDDDIGMLLFPGEAAMLRQVTGFRVHRISYMDTKAWLLTCNGTCRRDLRPLACRIFPLAPLVGKDGHIEILPDPRARLLCPLAGGEHLDSRFRRRVSRALRLLAQNPDMLRFMRTLSSELEELRRFY